MQQTANYNLNLPEGTDVVNPLVDYNPNFTVIDGAMKANADRTVGRATCIKSGTTHVVTRSNPDSPIINFTATGDWNEGDTMTIDSVIVSVFLPDGTAALDGAYIINSEVFGILNGTRFTLFSNSVDVSAKADKTDIAEVELGNTASRAYGIGELVYVNNVLYKVIAAISSGSTFTVGTNIESANVSDAFSWKPTYTVSLGNGTAYFSRNLSSRLKRVTIVSGNMPITETQIADVIPNAYRPTNNTIGVFYDNNGSMRSALLYANGNIAIGAGTTLGLSGEYLYY